MTDGSETPHGARAAFAWRAGGCVCVAVGAVGALVPLLPTTCFLILALACFTRGSPRLAARLLAHPRFGPPLAAWQRHRAISTQAKAAAVAGMSVAVFLTAVGTDGWLTPALVGATLLGVACYVVTRPNAELRTPTTQSGESAAAMDPAT